MLIACFHYTIERAKVNNMLNEIQAFLPDYKVKRVTPEALVQVADAYTTNESFFMLTQGRPATREDIANDLAALPPGFDASQKYYLGVFEEANPDSAVAVLDLLRGFPDESSAWIGLLLVHGGCKRRGIGSALTDAVWRAAKAVGVTSLRLGVVAGNDTALAFWKSRGFNELRRDKAMINGSIDTEVIVMERH